VDCNDSQKATSIYKIENDSSFYQISLCSVIAGCQRINIIEIDERQRADDNDGTRSEWRAHKANDEAAAATNHVQSHDKIAHADKISHTNKIAYALLV